MSGIIKAGSHARRSGVVRAEAYNLSEMSKEAGDYLDQIRVQAARIVNKAVEEAEQIRQHARQQGREDALGEAMQKIREETNPRLATALPALQQAARAVELARHQWQQRWNSQVVKLAAAIAEKVIRRELNRAPEITLELIQEALQLAAGGGAIQLVMHPDDIETIGEQAEAMLRQLDNLGQAKIVADPQVTRGGCRVTTEFGEIDQQIETQLRRIEEELT